MGLMLKKVEESGLVWSDLWTLKRQRNNKIQQMQIHLPCNENVYKCNKILENKIISQV